MRRMCIVMRSFEAKQYCREPLKFESFLVGERVVFLRPQDEHTLFVRELDIGSADPYIVDEETFESSTAPVPDNA